MEKLLRELKKKYKHLIEEGLFEKCTSKDILITFDDLTDVEAPADFLYVKFFIVNSIVRLAEGKCIGATISVKNLPMFLFMLDQLNLLEKSRIKYDGQPEDRKPLLELIEGKVPQDIVRAVLEDMDFVIDFRPSENSPNSVDVLITVNRKPLEAFEK